MMNKPVLMRVSDDAVVDNMAHKSYSLAIVLLSQMQRETGVLSKINQFRLCQCLYFTRRYVAALEKAKQFIAAGNTMPEMYFLRGMCHFQMGQWTLAIEMFKRKKRECVEKGALFRCGRAVRKTRFCITNRRFPWKRVIPKATKKRA